MVVDFTCGVCESSMTMDSENDDAIWLLVYRWANAHTGCGWVTSGGQADGPPKKMLLGPADQADPADQTEVASAETLDE